MTPEAGHPGRRRRPARRAGAAAGRGPGTRRAARCGRRLRRGARAGPGLRRWPRLAELGSAPTVLVATPTAREADHLAHDLAAFLGPAASSCCPAWETLPFERVSPATETMGRRLRALWRLRHGGGGGGGAPCVIVAPVRALLQRLGPRVEDAEPVVVRLGDPSTSTSSSSASCDAGYRREYQVEHRGELAVRGGIVDVFPSTVEPRDPHRLFGDEVDRLTEFDVADQRSVDDLEPRRDLRLPRARAHRRGAGRAPRRLAEVAPFAASSFARIAEGEPSTGSSRCCPGSSADEHLFADLLGASDRVVLVEPRRMRDRAAELLEEEAALADALAVDLGSGRAATRRRSPASTCRFDRLLARCPARVASPAPRRRGPATTVAGGDGLAARARRRRRRSPVGSASSRGGGSACSSAPTGGGAPSGWPRCWPTRASTILVDARRELVAAALARGAASSWPPLDQGLSCSGAKLAILAEPDLTGRRRPHRQARPRPRPVEGFFDDLQPGDYVVHHVHGVARLRRDGHPLDRRGGARLPPPRVPGRRQALRPLGPDRRDHALHRRRAAGAQPPERQRVAAATSAGPGRRPRGRAGARRALPAAPRRRPATPSRPTRPGRPRSSRPSPIPRRRTSCRRSRTSRPTWSDRRRWTASSAATSGFGKTEVAVRAVFKAVQDGKQAAVLVPTTLLAQQHFQTFSDRFAPYPVRVEVLSRFLTPAEARRRRRRARRRLGRRRGRHAPAPRRATSLQGPRPARRRRGAALRGLPQGGDRRS